VHHNTVYCADEFAAHRKNTRLDYYLNGNLNTTADNENKAIENS